MPSLKRRRTSHEQIKSAEAFDSAETGPNHPGTEVSGAVARSCKRYMTQRSLVSVELHFATPLSSKTQRCDECEVLGDKPAAAPTVPSLSRADPFQNAPPPIESYPADAFTAITFCFPGFDDDMEDLFENSTQDAGMANTSFADVVEVTEQEHTLGELSKANLQIAKSLFESNGVVAWRCLWPRNDKKVERETLDALGILPPEKNFIYVNTRSLLPREIVYNKASWPLKIVVLLPH
ncbi:uncharacterized protein PAC_06169 [Phialocephala subalpina]|uniref:Uncharacterized protein n=1 Tax=Phialocephala subalpina TaxID=576137 RepID=A0A1L7WU38_9HELO|nr:uncharacterized protein PAC_06169 [Phialocephala subalpina]